MIKQGRKLTSLEMHLARMPLLWQIGLNGGKNWVLNLGLLENGGAGPEPQRGKAAPGQEGEMTRELLVASNEAPALWPRQTSSQETREFTDVISDPPSGLLQKSWRAGNKIQSQICHLPDGKQVYF